MSTLVAYSDSEASPEEESSEEESTSQEEEEESYEEENEVSSADDVVRAVLSTLLTSVVQASVEGYREVKDSDSEVSSDSEEESTDEEGREEPAHERKLQRKPKAEEPALPPIEDLQISVPAYECVHLGQVESLVGDTAVVKGAPGKPAMDLDSVLFSEGGAPLGRVSDVFGPVIQPFYAVRFNSAEHAASKGVCVGSSVFCAPRTEHSAFVFLDQLRRMKGSDASWLNDEEPPTQCLDFSDDEQERQAKRERKQQGQGGEGQEGHSAHAGGRKRPHANSLFYRQNRRYNPRDYGPIRWNSQHLAHEQQQQQQSLPNPFAMNVTRPPPPPPPRQ